MKTGFLCQNMLQNERFWTYSVDTTMHLPKPSKTVCLSISFPHSFVLSLFLTCAVCKVYHVFGPIFPFFGYAVPRPHRQYNNGMVKSNHYVPRGSFCAKKFERYGSMPEWYSENTIFWPKQAPKWEVLNLQHTKIHVFAQTNQMNWFVYVIGSFPPQICFKSIPHMCGVRNIPCFWPCFPIYWVMAV